MADVRLFSGTFCEESQVELDIEQQKSYQLINSKILHHSRNKLGLDTLTLESESKF